MKNFGKFSNKNFLTVFCSILKQVFQATLSFSTEIRSVWTKNLWVIRKNGPPRVAWLRNELWPFWKIYEKMKIFNIFSDFHQLQSYQRNYLYFSDIHSTLGNTLVRFAKKSKPKTIKSPTLRFFGKLNKCLRVILMSWTIDPWLILNCLILSATLLIWSSGGFVSLLFIWNDNVNGSVVNSSSTR